MVPAAECCGDGIGVIPVKESVPAWHMLGTQSQMMIMVMMVMMAQVTLGFGDIEIKETQNSLDVQWLRLHSSTAGARASSEN